MACMTSRPLLLTILPLALLAVGAPAQEPDALNTPECRAARTRLDVATAAADGRPGGLRALQAARERAARACFGQPADSAADHAAHSGSDARAGLSAPAPVVRTPPVTGLPPPRPSPLPSPAEPPPAVAIPRAAATTQCDATGCWDSTGRRLNRVGPGLAGPGGSCTVQGNAAMCP